MKKLAAGVICLIVGAAFILRGTTFIIELDNAVNPPPEWVIVALVGLGAGLSLAGLVILAADVKIKYWAKIPQIVRWTAILGVGVFLSAGGAIVVLYSFLRWNWDGDLDATYRLTMVIGGAATLSGITLVAAIASLARRQRNLASVLARIVRFSLPRLCVGFAVSGFLAAWHSAFYWSIQYAWWAAPLTVIGALTFLSSTGYLLWTARTEIMWMALGVVLLFGGCAVSLRSYEIVLEEELGSGLESNWAVPWIPLGLMVSLVGLGLVMRALRKKR